MIKILFAIKGIYAHFLLFGNYARYRKYSFFYFVQLRNQAGGYTG